MKKNPPTQPPGQIRIDSTLANGTPPPLGVLTPSKADLVTIKFMEALTELANEKPPKCNFFALTFFSLLSNYHQYKDNPGLQFPRSRQLLDFWSRNKDKKGNDLLEFTEHEILLLVKATEIMNELGPRLEKLAPGSDKASYVLKRLASISIPPADESVAEERPAEKPMSTKRVHGMPRRTATHRIFLTGAIVGLGSTGVGLGADITAKKKFLPGESSRNFLEGTGTILEIGGLGAVVIGSTVGGIVRYALPRAPQEIKMKEAIIGLRTSLVPPRDLNFRALNDELKEEVKQLGKPSKAGNTRGGP